MFIDIIFEFIRHGDKMIGIYGYRRSTKLNTMIDFGWMIPGKSKIIRKLIKNTSASVIFPGVQIMVGVDETSDIIFNSGGLMIRLAPSGDWHQLTPTSPFDIGDVGVESELAIDFSLTIPTNLSEDMRGPHNIQVILRYI